MTIPSYHTDFYAWTQAQAQALQTKDRPVLDVVHLAEVIEGSDSLHNSPARRVPLAYRRARHDAAADTGLPLATFPEVCPWPVAQVLDEHFWPEA